MIRRGVKEKSSSHLSPIKSGQELAPGMPIFIGTGCYGVSGPVPSAVLDKKIFKRTINSASNIKNITLLSMSYIFSSQKRTALARDSVLNCQ
jgi:hypothetical protein